MESPTSIWFLVLGFEKSWWEKPNSFAIHWHVTMQCDKCYDGSSIRCCWHIQGKNLTQSWEVNKSVLKEVTSKIKCKSGENKMSWVFQVEEIKQCVHRTVRNSLKSRIHYSLNFLHCLLVSTNAKGFLLFSSCGRAQLGYCIFFLTLRWKCYCNKMSMNTEYKESVSREGTSIHAICIPL